jgi:hypothetical protein
VPRVALLRMTANVFIDLMFGAIPILGDVFDVFWRANEKNVALLRRHMTATPVEQRRANLSDWIFLGGVAVIVLTLAVGSAVIAYYIIVSIGRWLA